MFLSRIDRRMGHVGDGFPWTVPLIAGLQSLAFTASVTFLVGENGSGKSTLLEGLAMGAGAEALGSQHMGIDPSLDGARRFVTGFKFTRSALAYTRLFLRAEDVFGFTNRMGRDIASLRGDAAALEGAGRAMAADTVRAEAGALAAQYGENPDGRSHGETFLHILQARLKQDGLYFLDEPETPLSPNRVLALIIMIEEMVAKGCQFVIATHSPLLLALPGAVILSADGGVLRQVAWEDLEHVRVTRAFLNDPESVLRRLR